MSLRESKKQSKKLKKAFTRLNDIYSSMPETKGCMEHIGKPKEEGGCGAWCCLLPGEYVYTPQGPKPISNVFAGDKVYTKGGVKKVVESRSKIVKEDILVIKTRYGRTLKVTKDHPIYCELVSRPGREKHDFDFVEAQNIKTGDSKRHYQHYVYIPKIGNYTSWNLEPVIIDLTDILDVYLDPETGKVFNTYRKRGNCFERLLNFDLNWAWVLGLYLAEGSCEDTVVSFHINSEESDLEERLFKFADEIGCRISSKINQGKSKTVRIFSSVFSKIMSFLGGRLCQYKKINDYLLSRVLGSKDLIASILSGHNSGDGYKKDYTYYVTTTSCELSQQVLFLNLMLNKFCGISSSNPENRKKAYHCYYHENVKHHDYIENDNYFMIPIDEVEVVSYNGPVFDIEVEEEHSFTTSIGEVHNCEKQNPQVLYCEFLMSWRHVLNNWAPEDVADLIEAAISNYLSPRATKGCIFWDKESKLCKQHETRPFNCFLPKTIVYTLSGPKYISDILAGDRVLTNDGSYQRVLNTASRLHVGHIYGVCPQGSSVYSWSTSDHRWLVARQKDKRKTPETEYIEAENLLEKRGKQLGDYLVYPRLAVDKQPLNTIKVSDYIGCVVNKDRAYPYTSHVPENQELQSIPSVISIDEDFLFLIGIYLAEGYSSSSSASFCMNVEEKKYLDRIAFWLEAHSIRYKWDYRKNGTNLVLRIDSCLFARLMKSMCGHLAANKEIHCKLFELLSNKQLMSIFEAYNIGDGRKNPKHIKYSVSTVSLKLASQVCQILLINNIYPRIKEAHYAKDGRISYEVHVHYSSFKEWRAEEGQGSKAMYSDGNVFLPLSEVKKDYYEGPVIDIEVENNPCFVTLSGIAHNCRMYGIIPDEEFKPRYERLKILYKDNPLAELHDQCDKVSTVNGKEVTPKQSDAWWKKMKDVEKSIGINAANINDSPGGTYLTYHDHLLMQICGDDVMQNLQTARLYATPMEKKEVTVTLMNHFRANLQKMIKEAEDARKTENQENKSS